MEGERIRERLRASRGSHAFVIVVDEGEGRRQAHGVFGRSIVRRAEPAARRVQPRPPFPFRTFLLAALAVGASAYALVDHYMRPAPAPVEKEIPAPELVQVAP